MQEMLRKANTFVRCGCCVNVLHFELNNNTNSDTQQWSGEVPGIFRVAPQGRDVAKLWV